MQWTVQCSIFLVRTSHGLSSPCMFKRKVKTSCRVFLQMELLLMVASWLTMLNCHQVPMAPVGVTSRGALGPECILLFNMQPILKLFCLFSPVNSVPILRNFPRRKCHMETMGMQSFKILGSVTVDVA